ncbi:MAG: malate synthase A, partial [Actinomycetota bacterium]|nr:malate synthase A [Actinomycetota bacterium]
MATGMRLELQGPTSRRFDPVLTPEALEFIGALQREFGPRRAELLRARGQRRARLADGEQLDFLADTEEVRNGDWQVARVPDDLQQRWVEITGPTERKMVINALNSGADGFMADFEDANAPTWHNMVEGHINLRDAIEGTITYDGSDGRHYELGPEPATLLVRPRGWHLPERHLLVDGEPVSGSLFDFGLFFFHCGSRLLRRGSGPYFYLPKLESHLEARLWNDVFQYSQDAAGIERGTIKATVLIETLPAAFEMDEILYELREHSAGLNAGRWDYIFSAIKCFPERPEMVLPDRGDVTMTVPFMRAYTELLAATCHHRGAHAMGGMAALIPSRKDEEANEKALAAVRADKEREVKQGYDGTWVAHPDLVPVAREVFEKGLNGAPNQLARQRDDVHVAAEELLDLAATPGEITDQGLRTDVSIGFQYVSFWLGGRGAAAINSMMEDAATAEISRSQIWQWVHHQAKLADGRTVT